MASFLVHRGDEGWRWLLLRNDGSTVASSPQSYDSQELAEGAVRDFIDLVQGATEKIVPLP